MAAISTASYPSRVSILPTQAPACLFPPAAIFRGAASGGCPVPAVPVVAGARQSPGSTAPRKQPQQTLKRLSPCPRQPSMRNPRAIHLMRAHPIHPSR
jgi:hypothetical protein